MVRPATENAATIHWRILMKAPAPMPGAAAPALSLAPRGSQVASFDGLDLPFANLNLPPGDYRVEATAENGDGVFGDAVAADITLVPAGFGEVKVFPNPWRADQHAGHPITWNHLAYTTTIKVFTVAGQAVRTFTTTDSSQTWDLKNDSGEDVASGIYLYVVRNDQDEKIRGKLAVIR
jgi:hypothetical protein